MTDSVGRLCADGELHLFSVRSYRQGVVPAEPTIWQALTATGRRCYIVNDYRGCEYVTDRHVASVEWGVLAGYQGA